MDESVEDVVQTQWTATIPLDPEASQAPSETRAEGAGEVAGEEGYSWYAEQQELRAELGEDGARVFSVMASEDRQAAERLKAEWGSDWNINVEFARSAARELLTPDLKAYLEETGLGDHPSMIALAARIGRRLAAESGNPATVGQGVRTMPITSKAAAAPQRQLRAQIEQLRRERDMAVAKFDHDLAKEIDAELMNLYRQTG